MENSVGISLLDECDHLALQKLHFRRVDDIRYLRRVESNLTEVLSYFWILQSTTSIVKLVH